jgi:hypothetical protein
VDVRRWTGAVASRRPEIVDAWPYALVTVALVYAFWVPLTGDRGIPFDLPGFHLPILQAVQQYLAGGAFPAWDPYTYGGSPLYTNAQAQVAYPPQLVLSGFLALVDARLSEHVLNVFSVAHMWVAGLGVVLLARSRGMGNAAAAFAGVFVLLNGETVSQAQHLAMTETFAWIPLSLWTIDRLREEVTARRVVGLGVLFALMITAGFTPMVLACGLLLALWSIVPLQGARRVLPAVAGGLGVGVVLSSVVLVPTVAMLDVYPSLGAYPALPTSYLQTVLLPNAFGHWLPGLEQFRGVDLTNSYLYVGAGGVIALPLALTSGRPALRDAGIAAAMLLVCFGPIAEWLADTVQDASDVGRLWRPLLIFYVATIPLGLALAHAFTRRPSRRQLAVLAGWLVVVALLPLEAFDQSASFLADAPRRELLALAAAVGLAVAWACVPTTHRIHAALPIALVAVLAIEIATTVPDRYFIVSKSPPLTVTPTRDSQSAGVVEFLQSASRREDRVAADLPSLPSDWAGFPTVWRVQNVNGFQPQLSRFLIDRVRRLEPAFTGDRTFPVTPLMRPFLDEMAVRFIVVSAGADRFAGQDGYRAVFRGGPYVVYEVDDRGPRAREVSASCLRGRDPDRLLACPSRPVPVELVATNERRFATTGGRVLITGEPWFPGWSATADGEDVPVRRVGYLTAVDVPAGATDVRLDYGVPRFGLGLALSFLAALGCALAVASPRLRRRA